MEYRVAGSTGVKLSIMGLGCLFKPSQTTLLKELPILVKYALDHGINYFDTAESYANGESEQQLGDCLKHLNISRDSFCVSTKVFWGGSAPTQSGLNRKHLIEGCEASLKRLSLAYIDFLLCHKTDPLTDIDEVVFTMNHLIAQGKILYWGTSGWSVYQIMQAYLSAQKNNLRPPVLEQTQYNLLTRYQVEVEYPQLARDFGLAITTWSPLCHGLLTGKYLSDDYSNTRLELLEYDWLKQKLEQPQAISDLKKIETLSNIAKSENISMAQLAIGWCLSSSLVSSVLIGAKNINQLKDNLTAIACYKNFSIDLKSTIEDLMQNKPYPNQNFYEKKYQ